MSKQTATDEETMTLELESNFTEKREIPQLEHEVVSHIYRTFDYDRFKIVQGNRGIIPSHLRDLMESFDEEKLAVFPKIIAKDSW